ncbi:hypothetical protein [Corynebacterium bovis]|uniref:Uncharacterized protein n=2 Tax=Corynebacterium bovis TaxID=36808 RepID=A0A3R8PBK6_9CORY|nr:hypothetical protein [Corynebacterium bovis]MBB3115925.1 membrane protein YdbS with pleckstrin-like domain [Corynebacterium bovis DSM 20582 = CIP 54.80]MDH2456874.1 hypothetical protein [Corynebacterium bovis]MDK8511761.1 hypothetical protein [Corynebacterium bovis]MDN8580121.1 hypothetical protein [Corynebacterium bovis]QQC46884.1 hypothetical protein I6I09_07150 [Corynebacterium bovis]
MSTPELVVTMSSVFVGFLLFGAAFATFSYRRSPKVVWSLFAAAIVCMTVVPTTVAVFWASLG